MHVGVAYPRWRGKRSWHSRRMRNPQFCVSGTRPMLQTTLSNYVSPVCCVDTVCHQVRCMYWGHLGHFHRAISHSKWHKIVCMRYLACTFSQMKSINMFSMFFKSGVPRHFPWRFIAVWIYNLTVFMFMYVNVDLKLWRQYAETWVIGVFSCSVRQGKYILGLGNSCFWKKVSAFSFERHWSSFSTVVYEIQPAIEWVIHFK